MYPIKENPAWRSQVDLGEDHRVWEMGDVVRIRAMVTVELDKELGVEPHKCLLVGIDVDPRAVDLSRILSHHGVSRRNIRQYTRHINRDGGAVVLTHGVPGYGEDSDYIVFPGSFGRDIFPSVLSEELTHGKHLMQAVERGLNWRSYGATYPMVVREFLGFAGGRIAERVVGSIPRQAGSGLFPSFPTDSQLSHFIGYQAADLWWQQTGGEGIRELFTAPSAETFWSAVKKSLGPFTIPYENIIWRLNGTDVRLKSLSEGSGAKGLVDFVYDNCG